MAAQLSLSDQVVEAIGAAYERWDGRGWPGELVGGDVPLASRIAQVAEFIEVANRIGGAEAARQLARERRGGAFDPALADLVEVEADVILSGLDSIGVWDAVIDAEPALAVVLEGERFDATLLAVANFVDLKSPYFLGHGRAVAELAAEAGTRSGLTDAGVQLLRRAGLAWARAARDLERHSGQARAVGRRRMGARPPSALSDRAHAPPVRGASARGSDRSPTQGTARRLGVPARTLGRRDLT
jgi:hypothetical protein